MNTYFITAKNFCAWAESLKSLTKGNAPAIIVKIMDIYIASSSLEYPPETEEIEYQYNAVRLDFTASQFNTYWETQTPYACKDPICGSLYDDLTSIYNDVREGVILFEQGYCSEATWQWKWNFENHWKYHAVDAIRALNTL